MEIGKKSRIGRTVCVCVGINQTRMENSADARIAEDSVRGEIHAINLHFQLAEWCTLVTQ